MGRPAGKRRHRGSGQASLRALREGLLQFAPARYREKDLGGEGEPGIRVAALANLEERADLAQRLGADLGRQAAPGVR